MIQISQTEFTFEVRDIEKTKKAILVVNDDTFPHLRKLRWEGGGKDPEEFSELYSSAQEALDAAVEYMEDMVPTTTVKTERKAAKRKERKELAGAEDK